MKPICLSIIKFPSTEERLIISNYFEHKYKLKGRVGDIDGTHIPVKAPSGQNVAYTNRKGFTAVTLQGICDHHLKFTDCFVGYPSSVHDSRIFRNSDNYIPSYHSKHGRFFWTRGKIIGDKAYPVLAWCIPPFINRGNLTDAQTYFNKVHASCRSVIERSWALLFGRFRRLRYIDTNLYQLIPSTIIAAFVLHNICLNYKDDIEVNMFIEHGLEYARRNIVPEERDMEIAIVFAGSAERNRMAAELWRRRR
ncbi:hypothetical protein NQ314_018708 [Rhamnusium bicolor]|uniref:DDE Tnp4 domain-containing protein n=1 Tax=Rhamnusium bicolor TaxID=1586634 RepID=A0AAV8WQU3_9CUCU|nr:hypothetical protein NQ314_018708 [Rhamnusium bicolor]